MVIGIDPGLTRMGFAVLEEAGSRIRVLASGTIRSEPSLGVPQRLQIAYDQVSRLLAAHPGAVALERVFLNQNRASAVPSLQSSGVVQLAAAQAGLEVFEYSPAQVKLAVVGVGSATKDQVRFMVKRLATGADPTTPDEADAIAIAIAHLNHRGIRRLEEAL